MMMEVWEEVERSALPGEGTVPLQTQRWNMYVSGALNFLTCKMGVRVYLSWWVILRVM